MRQCGSPIFPQLLGSWNGANLRPIASVHVSPEVNVLHFVVRLSKIPIPGAHCQDQNFLNISWLVADNDSTAFPRHPLCLAAFYLRPHECLMSNLSSMVAVIVYFQGIYQTGSFPESGPKILPCASIATSIIIRTIKPLDGHYYHFYAQENDH